MPWEKDACPSLHFLSFSRSLGHAGVFAQPSDQVDLRGTAAEFFGGLRRRFGPNPLVELGAGELVVNSIDADGTKQGYELILTRMIAEAVSIPVIASGGGGKPEHIYDVLTEGKADAALVASMLHYGEYTVGEIKAYLAGQGLKIRMVNGG